jgi:hypothetical protein
MPPAQSARPSRAVSTSEAQITFLSILMRSRSPAQGYPDLSPRRLAVDESGVAILLDLLVVLSRPRHCAVFPAHFLSGRRQSGAGLEQYASGSEDSNDSAQFFALIDINSSKIPSFAFAPSLRIFERSMNSHLNPPQSAPSPFLPPPLLTLVNPNACDLTFSFRRFKCPLQIPASNAPS